MAARSYKITLHAFALALLVAASSASAANAAGSRPLANADSTAASSPAPVDVRGVVRDANGSPIRGATIRLTSDTDTVRVKSDAFGKFHARLTANQRVSLLVQAYGFRDLLRAFRASGGSIEAALALPPPYPLGGIAVTMSEEPRFETSPRLTAAPPLALNS